MINGLGEMDKFISAGTIRDNKKNGTVSIKFSIVEYAKSYTKEYGMYSREIGYQRKGMNLAFYEDFQNCKLYFRKEDVLRASTYLSVNDQQRPNLVNEFKEAFIDNFIEGESIFLASW